MSTVYLDDGAGLGDIREAINAVILGEIHTQFGTCMALPSRACIQQSVSFHDDLTGDDYNIRLQYNTVGKDRPIDVARIMTQAWLIEAGIAERRQIIIREEEDIRDLL